MQLFIQSIITSLTLTVLMGMIQIGAGTGNALMLLGVTVVGLIMIFSLLSSALNAVRVAFTGLFNSFNSVTGGISVSGNAVAEGTENAATGAASAAAIKAQGGSSAMALGAMFDGQQPGQQAFYASRMLGGDETTAGQMLSEFGAGVYARNVGDEVGGPAGAAISGGLMASQMSNAARAETADQLASGLNRAAIQPANTATSAVIGYPAPGIQPFPADTTGTRPETGTNNRSRPADETGSTIRRSDIRPDSHAGPDRTKNERRRPQALSGNRTPPQDPSQPSNTSRRPPAGSSDSSAARPAEPPQNTVAASSRQGTSGTDSVPAQQFRRDRIQYLNAGQAVGAKPAQLKAMVRSAQQSETGHPTRQTVQAVRAQVVCQVGEETYIRLPLTTGTSLAAGRLLAEASDLFEASQDPF